MKINIEDLLGSLQAIRSPGTRIGLPDDPICVAIANADRLSACLDDALGRFRELRSGTDYLVNAEGNEHHRAVRIRFVQFRPCEDRGGEVEPPLKLAFRALRAELVKNGGDLHYWGGENYFNISLPFRGPFRERSPSVNQLPWDERYRYLLEHADWGSLRAMAFRFSHHAEKFAERCAELGLSRILIPSVGLCVHPWLFAGHGLSVIATDFARYALATLSQAERWPRLYSRAAFERWDIEQSASYASQGNPERFAQMSELENAGVRDSLRQRITFTLADWAHLPLDSGSVDAIFATNTLPRESPDEQLRVLKEWTRVVRPGGAVFIAQHNFHSAALDAHLRGAGWVETDILGARNRANLARPRARFTTRRDRRLR